MRLHQVSKDKVLLAVCFLSILLLSKSIPTYASTRNYWWGINPLSQKSNDEFQYDLSIDHLPGSNIPSSRITNFTEIKPLSNPIKINYPIIQGKSSHLSLDTLILIYSNTAMGSFSEADIQRLEENVIDTAIFLWRQSHLKLKLNLEFMVIDDYKDITEFTEYDNGSYWFLPHDGDDDGESIDNDLTLRGVGYDDYDIINYFWASDGTYDVTYGGTGGLASWSFGTTGVSMNVAGPWWFDNPDDMTAFPHEIHHAIDSLYEYSGFSNYFHADRPWWLPGEFGENWDFWTSGMRRIPVEDWFKLKEPWGTIIYELDEDEDGVPDNKIGEFPTEAILGSSSLSRDSDNDRLEDLDEVMAGIFENSKLTQTNSDGDTKIDGDDIYPLYSTNIQIPKRTQALNGEPNQWFLISDSLYEQNAPLSATIYSNWDDDYLYFMLIIDRFAFINLRIDAMNDGWFHGKDNYNVWVIPNYSNPDIVILAHIWDCSDSITEKYLIPMWDNSPEYPYERLIVENDIGRYAREYGSGYLVQLAIPRNDQTSLIPDFGKKLGLLIKFTYLDNAEGTYAMWLERDAWVRPLLVNQIDNNPPNSQVNPLPPITYNNIFKIDWDGTDIETDVMYYDVQYRDGEFGEWSNLLLHTTSNSTMFEGEFSHVYYFRVRAWDKAGNVEEYPPEGAEVWTEVFKLFEIYQPLILNR